ncbi:MAG: amidohydrolase family protein, partial [Bifidobacteriaceae bacterium]|nr:amidohydrolase family protein [Bifidobacteriaceae bacterium]
MMIANARLVGGSGRVVDVAVSPATGRIAEIRPAGQPGAASDARDAGAARDAGDAGPAGEAGDAGEAWFDADGGWLLPGFWDEHVHFRLWAEVSRRLDVSQARSAAEAARLVGAAAARLAGAEATGPASPEATGAAGPAGAEAAGAAGAEVARLVGAAAARLAGAEATGPPGAQAARPASLEARGAAGPAGPAGAGGRGAAEGQILVAAGFRDGLWPDRPHFALLDPVTGALPTYVLSGDLHSIWLNSAALARAGHAGHPTGLLREDDCFKVTWGLAEAPDSVKDRWVAEAGAKAAARGVTGIVDLDLTWALPDWQRREAAGLTSHRVECGV